MTHSKLLLAAALATAITAASGQEADTLAKASASGTIVMGVRESSVPLSYALGPDKFVGYHVEICERVLAVLLPQAKIKYQAVTSANRIPLLQNGTIDLECGSTTNNAARKKEVAFVNTTYVTEARLAVKTNSGITSVEQLNGKSVSTTTGTTLVQRLRRLEKTGVSMNVVMAKDHADAFLLLESGRVDAFAMDDNTLAGLIATSKKPDDFRIVGKPLGIEPIAIMIRKDDPRFKTAFDEALRKLIASGEVERIYAKWLLQPIPPGNTTIAMPQNSSLKTALSRPNDDPAEAYNQ